MMRYCLNIEEYLKFKLRINIFCTVFKGIKDEFGNLMKNSNNT